MLYYKKSQSRLENKAGKRLWYTTIVAGRRVIDTKEIARELSKRSGHSEGEIIGLLHDLGQLIRNHVSEGDRVVLNGLGSFKIGVRARGAGVEDPEKVSAKQFNHLSIIFTPESTSSRALNVKEVSLIAPERIRFALASDLIKGLTDEGNGESGSLHTTPPGTNPSGKPSGSGTGSEDENGF